MNRLLESTAKAVLPRILTQICRDPESPFYGSCDRNWWHYKIRDFPSVILQQAGYAAAIAADLPFAAAHAQGLKTLATASARFWNQRACLHGAFEEYYPFEQGYPPVAFSTLAVAKLCKAGIVPLGDIEAGLQVAAVHLLTRFEAEAANQQVAGTAALAVIRAIAPSLVPEAAFQAILSRILALQNREGWFPEYHGPDLGYLTVTVDCLWDLYDVTGDERCHTAILSAFDYIAWFVLGPTAGAGMHNARNTDYLVPYGLARLATSAGPRSEAATKVFDRLFGSSALQNSALAAVDDRYWCHYIGHSVFRALQVLEAASAPLAPTSAGSRAPLQRSMPESGHVLLGGDDARSPTLLVSTRKGGILTAIWCGGEQANDFGWTLQSGKRLLVTHWWSQDWSVTDSPTEAGCDGFLVAHREHASTPWKHMALRIASFVLGRRLIAVLKRLVIFKKPQSRYHFSRRISIEGDTVLVSDRITGIQHGDQIRRAPRSSKRHVASADSYHPEDFITLRGVERSEVIERADDTFACVTRYHGPQPTAH